MTTKTTRKITSSKISPRRPTVMSVAVPDEIGARVRALAEADGVSVSDVLRRALDRLPVTASAVRQVRPPRAERTTDITRHTPLESLPELLRVDEAARWLDLATGTVYEMTRRGELASVRLGRLLRVRRDSLPVNGTNGHTTRKGAR